MNRVLIAVILASLTGGPVLAQSSPVAAPAPGETPQNLNPASATTTVTVAPDPSATAMADPQSAAQFGSPSAVDSPSSPMPNPNGWPAIKPSAKRPPWVKKAPAAAAAGQPSPH